MNVCNGFFQSQTREPPIWCCPFHRVLNSIWNFLQNGERTFSIFIWNFLRFYSTINKESVFCKYFLAKIPDKIPEFSFSKMAKIPDACISAFWSSMIPFQTFYLMGFIYEYCRILRQYFFSVSTRQVWCQGLWSIYPSRPQMGREHKTSRSPDTIIRLMLYCD